MRFSPQDPNQYKQAAPDDTTIADDTTRSLAPSPQPKAARAQHGKAPRWPLLGNTATRVRGSPYSRNAGRAKARSPARRAARPAPPPAYVAPMRERRVYDVMRGHLPRFHVIHVVLLVGVGALWLAITQPWGSDAAGAPIYIQQFSIPRISGPSGNVGPLALQTATGIAVAAVIMAVGLLLINLMYLVLKKLLHRLGLPGLAGVLFIPLLAMLIVLLLTDLTLAAGFGGLSIVSQLPFVRDHGFASIGAAHAAPGFYLWWVGIGVALIGTVGEIFVGRG